MSSTNDKDPTIADVPNSFIAERVGVVPPSVWDKIGNLAQEYNCVSLTGGVPDFDPPERLKQAAINAINAGFNQYCFNGAESLRTAIAAKVKWYNGIESDPDTDITVCCGSTEALMASAQSILNPGDEIILFEPFFPSYVPMVKLVGAKPKFVTLNLPDCQFDPEQIKDAFSNKPKAILLNSPQNPLGKVFSRDELQLIADLCTDNNVVCLTDEIYEHFVYEGEHISIASIGSMADRTITVSGFSKVFASTGWRVGYTIAEKSLSQAIQSMHNFLTVCAPHPLQVAIAELITEFNASYYDELRQLYKQKRDLLLNILTKSGFNCIKPNGAFYIFTDIAQMGYEDNYHVVKHMIENARVAAVPCTGFFDDEQLSKQFVRFAFCKKEETLLEVGKRLDNVDI